MASLKLSPAVVNCALHSNEAKYSLLQPAKTTAFEKSFVQSRQSRLLLRAAPAHHNSWRSHPLVISAAVTSEASVKGTELDAITKFSEVVPDTVIFDDFERFPPTAATVTSSLLLGITSLPDARYDGAIESALAYGKCFLENKGASRMSCFMDKALVNVGTELTKLVPGRVSTEIDPRLANNSDGIVNQVRRLLELYEELSVPRNRLLFKIPATWEGIEAARVLEAEGIQTHVTLVYSFAQAAACAQAGVSVVQIFVGRIRDWARNNKGDVAIESALQRGEDPGISLVSRTYNYIHKSGFKTKVMASALRNKQDVFSLLGVDYLVVPVKILKALKEAPADLDEEHSYQRQLSPSTAQSAEFSAGELAKGNQGTFNAALGSAAEQLLAAGLESQSRDILRVEEHFDKIWPPPNV